MSSFEEPEILIGCGFQRFATIKRADVTQFDSRFTDSFRIRGPSFYGGQPTGQFTQACHRIQKFLA